MVTLSVKKGKWEVKGVDLILRGGFPILNNFNTPWIKCKMQYSQTIWMNNSAIMAFFFTESQFFHSLTWLNICTYRELILQCRQHNVKPEKHRYWLNPLKADATTLTYLPNTDRVVALVQTLFHLECFSLTGTLAKAPRKGEWLDEPLREPILERVP